MQKQSYSRKLLSVLLAFVMLFSMMSVGTMSFASAATKKVTVSKVQVTNLTNKVFYVAKGKTVKLATKVTVTPNKAANKKVSYKSKSTKIATVSSKGVVKGKKVGTTKITVTSKSNKSKKTTITVKVTNPVTSVKLNKKDATLTVGGKTTLSATVSPKKATKNVSWTSSNPKVATVSSKGVVTAKAAGTATITAKAIDGTNKKASCKVTVKNKATTIPAPTIPTPTNVVNMTSVSVYNPRNYEYSITLLVSLSAAKPLEKNDFVVKEKMYANGNYNRIIDVESVYTTDNKNYRLYLKYEMGAGKYYSVTVNALNGVKTKETFFKPNGKDSECLVCGTVGDDICDKIYFDNLLGNITSKIESGTLPKGITFDSKYNELKGNFEECANNKRVVFSGTDEFGTVSKTTVSFLVGDENTIYAENKTIGDDNDKCYAYNDITYQYREAVYIHAVGGSGWYNMSIVNDYDGLFYLNNGEEVGNSAYIRCDSSKLAAGTYKVQVKFTDIDNPELTAIGTVTIIVNPTVAVTNVVNNSQNTTSTIYYANKDTGEGFESNGYTNNETTVNVPVGTYDVYTFDAFYNKIMLKTSLKIAAATTVQLNIPNNLYTVSIKATVNGTPLQEDYNANVYLYDKDDSMAYYDYVDDGAYEFVLVPAGTYKVEVKIYDAWVDENVTVGTDSVTVSNANTTKELSFTYESAAPEPDSEPDYTMTSVGTLDITVDYDSKIVAFTPSETATYNIYSSDADNDPYCYVYDADKNEIGYYDDGDEDSNFSFSLELTAGQTYYLFVAGYDGAPCSFVLNIEKQQEQNQDQDQPVE